MRWLEKTYQTYVTSPRGHVRDRTRSLEISFATPFLWRLRASGEFKCVCCKKMCYDQDKVKE
jgi:hypothetical protein